MKATRCPQCRDMVAPSPEGLLDIDVEQDTPGSLWEDYSDTFDSYREVRF
jgi:hypothetical protein